MLLGILGPCRIGPCRFGPGRFGPCRLRRRSRALIGLPFTAAWAIAGNIATVKRQIQSCRRRYMVRVVVIFIIASSLLPRLSCFVSLASSTKMVNVPLVQCFRSVVLRILAQRWWSQSLVLVVVFSSNTFHGNGSPSLCVDVYLDMNEALGASILLSIQMDWF